jgi:hypothetical protein
MHEEPYEELEHGKLPDPEAQAMDELSRRIYELEEMVRQITANRVGR